MKILHVITLFFGISANLIHAIEVLPKDERKRIRNLFAYKIQTSQHLQRFKDHKNIRHWFFYYFFQMNGNTLQQSEKNEFLRIASEIGYYSFIEILVKIGAEVNHTAPAEYSSNGDNYTPLHRALRYGANLDTIYFLLKNGAYVHAVDNMGRAPLHLAMLGYTWGSVYQSDDERLKKIKLLLEHGALINAPDINGDTPLHLAIEHTSSRVVRLLLKNGADMQTQNNKGETPLDIAKKHAVFNYNVQDILRIFMHYNSRCALL